MQVLSHPRVNSSVGYLPSQMKYSQLIWMFWVTWIVFTAQAVACCDASLRSSVRFPGCPLSCAFGPSVLHGRGSVLGCVLYRCSVMELLSQLRLKYCCITNNHASAPQLPCAGPSQRNPVDLCPTPLTCGSEGDDAVLNYSWPLPSQENKPFLLAWMGNMYKAGSWKGLSTLQYPTAVTTIGHRRVLLWQAGAEK